MTGAIHPTLDSGLRRGITACQVLSGYGIGIAKILKAPPHIAPKTVGVRQGIPAGVVLHDVDRCLLQDVVAFQRRQAISHPYLVCQLNHPLHRVGLRKK
jgi:hypothetical protein